MLELQPDQPVSFGRYTFQASVGELRRGAREVRLTPKAAAVLAALVARPGALLTKDGLFEAVWPGVAVSDAALTSCIRELRDALGDDARRPRYIQTIHRRGYRFVAPLPDVPAASLDLPRAPDHVVGRERPCARCARASTAPGPERGRSSSSPASRASARPPRWRRSWPARRATA